MTIDFAKFKECYILVIGDLMIDEYIWGKTQRISPEAPVPVVTVKDETVSLGGAGNVAHNIASLGAKVSLAGMVGDDRHGQTVLSLCRQRKIETAGIISSSHRPTTRKTRVIAADQHVLRVDHETSLPIDAKLCRQMISILENSIPAVDIVLISDYAKGLLTPELLTAVMAMSHDHNKKVIVDPKGHHFEKYHGASVLTPNKQEASVAAGIASNSEAALKQSAAKLFDITDADKILITCGKDGMRLMDRYGQCTAITARARQVFDVSGAGDTVLAVLGLAMASGASSVEAAEAANTAAGIVVGKVGTASVSVDELAPALEMLTDADSFKTIALADLKPLAADLKAKGKSVVFTNGCFDLLHAGHIQHFNASRKLGDVLIVAIDDDESVRQLKGSGRPVIKLRERVRVLNAIQAIDYVTVFKSDQLENIIDMVRPDVLTKGGDYRLDQVVGRQTVEKYGGRVVLTQLVADISSSRIIDRIKNNG